MADREELARMVGLRPQEVSEIMGELEAVGAVYRRKEGRGVRYFVNPLLGTHLTGAARDKAQAEAPRLHRPLEHRPVALAAVAPHDRPQLMLCVDSAMEFIDVAAARQVRDGGRDR